MLTEPSPRSLRPVLSFPLLLALTAALHGCVGDPFRAAGQGGGGGDGGNGAGGDPGGSGGSGAGGSGDGGSAPIPVTWPDSRTVRCINGAMVVTPCPSSVQDYYGQDGNYQIAVPTYMANDKTVTDSVTGLVWEKAAVDANFALDGAMQHCAGFAAGQVGGYDDWRLPTRLELVSILDHGFENTLPEEFTSFGGFYWSSSEVFSDPSRAWGVLTNNGTIGYAPKTQAVGGRALCVRGDRPSLAPSFSIEGQVVLDQATGLVWQRQPAIAEITWGAALARCEQMNLAGKTDWRLPSAKELLSIVDDTLPGPAINEDVFPATQLKPYWSSTPSLTSVSEAIVIDFSTGVAQSKSITEMRRARCVRSDAP